MSKWRFKRNCTKGIHIEEVQYGDKATGYQGGLSSLNSDFVEGK